MTRILVALFALFAFAACSSPDPTPAATEPAAPSPDATPTTAATSPDPTATVTESAAPASNATPTTAAPSAPTTATPPAPAGWRSFEETTSTVASRIAFIGDEANPPALVISCAEFDGGRILAISYRSESRPEGGVADGESVSLTFAVGEETLTLSGEGALGAVLVPFDRSDDVIDFLLRGTDGVTVNDDEFTLNGYAAAVEDIRPCEAQ